LKWVGERPRLSFVRPIIWLQTMRFTPITRSKVAFAAVPEIRAELEARGRLCLGFAAGTAPGHDFRRREAVVAGAAPCHPVAQRADVVVALGSDAGGELERFAQLLRNVRMIGHPVPLRRGMTFRRGGLDRAHDRPVLVNPHAVWNVDDAKELIDAVGAVD